MHDGSMKTLEEVVDHYIKGGIKNEFLDEEVFNIKLSKEDAAECAPLPGEASPGRRG